MSARAWPDLPPALTQRWPAALTPWLQQAATPAQALACWRAADDSLQRLTAATDALAPGLVADPWAALRAAPLGGRAAGAAGEMDAASQASLEARLAALAAARAAQAAADEHGGDADAEDHAAGRGQRRAGELWAAVPGAPPASNGRARTVEPAAPANAAPRRALPLPAAPSPSPSPAPGGAPRPLSAQDAHAVWQARLSTPVLKSALHSVVAQAPALPAGTPMTSLSPLQALATATGRTAAATLPASAGLAAPSAARFNDAQASADAARRIDAVLRRLDMAGTNESSAPAEPRGADRAHQQTPPAAPRDAFAPFAEPRPPAAAPRDAAAPWPPATDRLVGLRGLAARAAALAAPASAQPIGDRWAADQGAARAHPSAWPPTEAAAHRANVNADASSPAGAAALGALVASTPFAADRAPRPFAPPPAMPWPLAADAPRVGGDHGDDQDAALLAALERALRREAERDGIDLGRAQAVPGAAG